MRRRMLFRRALVLVAAVGLSSLAPVRAQQPDVTNAQVQTRSAQAGLDREFRALSSEPSLRWVGYRVPIVAGRHQMCCGSSGDGDWGCCGACKLEGRDSGTVVDTGERRVPLEGPREMFVLYRLDQRRVTHIRTFTPECGIDAGGVPFVWLTDVRPSDSVALLRSLAGADGVDEARRVGRSAIAAIAFHDGPEALDAMVALARNDASDRIRGEALFWLAQRAGDKAAAAITESIDRDPETEVKKKAVFALSQLPKDEGVPRLIQVARTNRNPVVRKQAMFWLGQSNDGRALTFFEEILKR